MNRLSYTTIIAKLFASSNFVRFCCTGSLISEIVLGRLVLGAEKGGGGDKYLASSILCTCGLLNKYPLLRVVKEIYYVLGCASC